MSVAHDSTQLHDALAAHEAPPWRPVSTRTLARRMGVTVQTLANWRVRENGPEWEAPVRGKGNALRYRPESVLEWLSAKAGRPRPGWLYSHDWLVGNGLVPDAEPDQETTLLQIAAIDPLIGRLFDR